MEVIAKIGSIRAVGGMLMTLMIAAWPASDAAAQGAAKPIRIVFPFPAGSAGDTLSRLVAASLQADLGRTVLVENRSGAGGITGTRSVVSADPDGTTLLIIPSAVATMIPLYNLEAGYNAEKDFVALTHLVSQDLALAAGPALPAKSLQELIEIIRKDPSKGSYGTPGAGSSLHLMGVKLAQVAGLPLVPVHYRGAALALNDVVAGQLPMLFSPMPDQIEQHRSGRIRIISTAGAKRSEFVEGVQTFKEAGIDINAEGWYAAFAPLGIPDALADELGRKLAATVHVPGNKTRLSQIGFMSVGSSRGDLKNMVSRDLAYWGPIFKSSGFKP